MISFRYHIVSIVSVFLALAVGVALGGGPLNREVDNTLVEQVQADRVRKAELRAELAAVNATNAFGDRFAETIAPGLVGQSLKDRVVSFLVLSVLFMAPGGVYYGVAHTPAAPATVTLVARTYSLLICGIHGEQGIAIPEHRADGPFQCVFSLR